MSFTALDAGVQVLRTAQRFLDLSEVKSNAQWSVPAASEELRAWMLETGWQPGWPYCAAFVEACVGHAYQALGVSPAVLQLIRARFTPSVMQTFANCGDRARDKVPQPGAVFFMQKDMSGLGHAGLVILPGRSTFCTIEGNTSPGIQRVAKDREGDGIWLKIRALDPGLRRAGLWLRGFLNPMASDEIERLAEEVSA